MYNNFAFENIVEYCVSKPRTCVCVSMTFIQCNVYACLFIITKCDTVI